MDEAIRRALIIGFLAYVFALACVFLFANTGLDVKTLFSFSLSEKIAKLYSANFVWFLLAVPLLGALASASAFWLPKTTALASVLLGSGLGLLLGALVTGLWAFWGVAVFFILGLAYAVWHVFIKKDEVKHWISFRLAKTAVQNHLLLVAVGLIVFSAMTILPQQDAFGQSFEDALASRVLGASSLGNLKEQLAVSMAAVSVQSQQAMINQIVLLPAYSDLALDAQNEKGQRFVQAMTELKNTVNAPGFERLIQNQFLGQLDKAPLSTQDLFRQVRQSLPWFSLLSEWLWLLFGLALASAWLFLSTLVFQPLGMLYGWVLNRLLGHFFKTQSA